MPGFTGFTIRLTAALMVVTFLSAFVFGGSTQSNIAQIASSHESLKQRLDAEIAFAESLCVLYPPQTQEWQKLIEQAKTVLANSTLSDENYYVNSVQPIEQILAPIGAAAKAYTIHCVGHAHIDMNWLWSWPETVAVTNDTFTTVLKLIDEFDDFYFSQSQCSVYEIVRENNPALFEQIKKQVAQGRWEVTAAQWVEGDKNLVSGESIARHLLYSRQFMKNHFNLKPEDVSLCWEPDTFGHAYSIPTILSKGGIKRYYLCRYGSLLMPPVFWWEGPDSSRLLVFNGASVFYNGRINTKTVEKLIPFSQQTGLKDWMYVYGVGDHGGGPTRQDIIRCHEMNSWPIYPNFKMCKANQYFDIIEQYSNQFPVVKNELNFEFTGCYTSQSEIKKFIRVADSELKNAETAALLANLMLDRPWPQERLHEAWINTLFGHFHDILPGSGVHWTREYQSGLFQNTAAITSMITTNSLREIAGSIDTSFAEAKNGADSGVLEQTAMGAGAGIGTEWGTPSFAAHFGKFSQPIIVFNPAMTARKELVKVRVWDPVGNPDDFKNMSFMVQSSDGQNLKTQTLDSGKTWGHHYIEVAFPAQVGVMGYASYAIKPDLDRQSSGNTAETVDEYTIENDFIKAVFDPSTGGIVSFVDKTTGYDLAVASDPLAVFEYILEKPDSMSAWTIYEPTKRVCPLNVISIKPKHQGPYVSSIEAVMKLNDSTLTTVFSLSAGQPWLEIEVKAFWVERGSKEIGTPKLRMQFPFAFKDARATYEIPFGSIERNLNHGEEVPAINWANVTGSLNNSNQTVGCVLLNDCKNGHSLDNSTLRLTLLRSSYEPDPLPEMGEYTMRLALAPHHGKLPVEQMITLGTIFNQRLQVISTDIHKGKFPAETGDLVSVSAKNVIVAGLKKSEDGSGIICRLLETAGKETPAKITLDKSIFGNIRKAVQTDLLERPIPSSVEKSQNSFTITVPANSIVTVLLSFKK